MTLYYLKPDEGKPWFVENGQRLTRIVKIVGFNPSISQVSKNVFINVCASLTRLVRPLPGNYLCVNGCETEVWMCQVAPA